MGLEKQIVVVLIIYMPFHKLYKIDKLCKKDTFACFIDAKKAFDCVNRDCLWYQLRKLGINGNFYNCIKSVYNELITSWFDVEIG